MSAFIQPIIRRFLLTQPFLWMVLLPNASHLAQAQETLVDRTSLPIFSQQNLALPGQSSASDRESQQPESTGDLSTTSSMEILIDPLPGATSPPVVTAIGASHDGRYLALAGDDHVIRLYDVSLAKHIGNLVGHRDWIQSIVFSAEVQQLYSAGNDGRVLRWQYQDSAEPVEILRLPFAIRSLSLATERQLLAMGGFSSEVKVWDIAANSWKYQFSCHCSDHNCIRFSPSGDKLLSCGRDGILEVWNMENGQEILHKSLHQKRISTAAFSADGSVITSASEDRHLVQYDLKSNEILLDREFEQTKLRSLCLINDHLVAVAGSDNSIRLYDMLSGTVIADMKGHKGSVAVMCPCNDYLVSGSFDTTVRIWNLKVEVGLQSSLSMPVSKAPLDVDVRMRIR